MTMNNRETFASLFNEIADGICVSDRQGNLLYMNPAGERLLEGFTDGKIQRTVCAMLCGHLSTPGHKECVSCCSLLDANSRETAVTVQGRHGPKQSYQFSEAQIIKIEQWKDLRVRCLKMVTPLFDSWENEKHFTLIEDVSAEAELERRKEGWRNMVEHDLRTPLTAITAALVCLEEVPEGQTLTAREKGLLAIALRGARRMVKLLEDDLDLARLDAGKMPVRPEAVSIADLLKKCVEEQASEAQAKRITVSLEVDPSFKATADPILLLRVAQNLLDNALKFTPESGQVKIGAKSNPGLVQLSFKDTGPGIPSEHLPLLFKRYYQAGARKEGKVKGSGLGLAFCREALAAMGGSIQVESKAGWGSEFIIQLPAA